MKKLVRIAACLLASSPVVFSAELGFSTAFSSGMVIQREAPVTVSGQGPAGERVKVTFAAQERSVKVGDDGIWKADFPALTAGGPYVLEASDGKATASVGDVLVGDVWVFSGQSNMQMGLDEAIGGAEAIASAAKDPKIRVLVMPKAGADTPQSVVGAKWRTSTPDSLNKFSAVAGFFAVHLHRDPALKDIPLGVIDTSFGGTCVEAWTPKGALPPIPKEKMSASMFNIPQGNLFNNMIAPLLDLRIKGAVWYQGEGNAGQPGVYAELLENMIAQWRKQWNAPELPFFIVQLPAFEGRANGLDWAWLREAQAFAAKKSPNTWLAVTYDTTNGLDLHPLEKQEIGQRLSLLAAKEVYRRDVVAHGPSVKGVSVGKDQLKVSFDSPLKISNGGKLLGFSIAGADGEYRFAEARIDGNDVLLKAQGISEPKTVRYAWSGLTDANLVNNAGLPAAPFRTDTQPPKTLAFQPIPTVYQILAPSYQLQTGNLGSISSLIVSGKQFLSAEPGGGTSFPGFFGPRNLPTLRELGPSRIELSDSSTRLEIACTDDSLVWTIRNDGKDALDFHIALAEQVKVELKNSSAGLTRGNVGLDVEGFDQQSENKLVTKIQPNSTRTLRLTVRR
ncbi:hypothetical protein JIN84_10725 [Luteolibacter yonseiensis]|uniref:Sialate O-acetylesterase domain-containing protein n=1 Tax=Luteolibacter yonseiensis TaxID=1144680 RepID=A0A934R301_9BACT|nr:sialate O-acetylesterase [Luteolibacter yonseiensis]MBK1816086.1 hypothetical protein [Luteolibacter yonseiensis]